MMARSLSPFRGRTRVALGLLLSFAVASVVVWRRSVGVSTAKAMQKAAAERRALAAERVTLERDIREAQSRRHVVAEAEKRLGLHVAPESQSRVLADTGTSR
jgi:formate-dependent nitrite reductase cytochrome c552 subunit